MTLETDDSEKQRAKEAIAAFHEYEREHAEAINRRWRLLVGTLAFVFILAAGYLCVVLWMSL